MADMCVSLFCWVRAVHNLLLVNMDHFNLDNFWCSWSGIYFKVRPMEIGWQNRLAALIKGGHKFKEASQKDDILKKEIDKYNYKKKLEKKKDEE